MADAESRSGSRQRGNLTDGPIGSTLLKFALPTLASSILQSLNGTINAIWVGRFLGENALAATSNANMVMFLLSAFVFGFGSYYLAKLLRRGPDPIEDIRGEDLGKKPKRPLSVPDESIEGRPGDKALPAR